MTLCKYSNILGEPGKGAHSIRVFNIAIIDVILTLILSLLLSLIIKYGFKINSTFVIIFLITSICLFTLGIILHKIFCVRTTIDKLLFG